MRQSTMCPKCYAMFNTREELLEHIDENPECKIFYDLFMDCKYVVGSETGSYLSRFKITNDYLR